MPLFLWRKKWRSWGCLNNIRQSWISLLCVIFLPFLEASHQLWDWPERTEAAIDQWAFRLYGVQYSGLGEQSLCPIFTSATYWAAALSLWFQTGNDLFRRSLQRNDRTTAESLDKGLQAFSQNISQLSACWDDPPGKTSSQFYGFAYTGSLAPDPEQILLEASRGKEIPTWILKLLVHLLRNFGEHQIIVSWLRRSMPCFRLFWTAIFLTALHCLRILLWCARTAKNTARHLHSPATWSQTDLYPTISGRKRDSLCCFTADTICIRKPFWTHRIPPLIQGFGSILCLWQTACILTMYRTGIFTCRNVWQLISAKRLTLSVLPPTFHWFPMNHTGKAPPQPADGFHADYFVCAAASRVLYCGHRADIPEFHGSPLHIWLWTFRSSGFVSASGSWEGNWFFWI